MTPLRLSFCVLTSEIEDSQGAGAVANVMHVQEAEANQAAAGEATASRPGTDEGESRNSINLSRALLASVAGTNISTLQQGLDRQNIYWEGSAWISSALRQRVEGMGEVDLARVTEQLGSFVRLPDAGLVGRKASSDVAADGSGPPGAVGVPGYPGGQGNGVSHGNGGASTPFTDWLSGIGSNVTGHGNGNGTGEYGARAYMADQFDFSSTLPFDPATNESGQNVVEQDVSIPMLFDSQWFS